MIKCVISGGQTGADQGGLEAALQLGIVTSGYAPKGWKTEAGPAEWLEEKYGLMEHSSEDYAARTKANVSFADATVIFGRRSQGSNLTEEICRKLGKPCAWVMWTPKMEDDDRKSAESINIMFASYTTASGTTSIPLMRPYGLRIWLKRLKVATINVAGNRESVNPGIGEFTKNYLLEALR